MSEQTPNQEENPTSPDAQPPAPQQQTDATALQARIAELETEIATLRQTSAPSADPPTAADHSEVTAARAQAAAATAAAESMLNAQIAGMPDDIKEMVNNIPGDAIAKAEWLGKSLPTITDRILPHINAAAQVSDAPAMTAADIAAKERAERQGVKFADDADYLAHKERAKQRAGR